MVYRIIKSTRHINDYGCLDKITSSKVVNQKVKKGFSNVRCPKCNGNIFFEADIRNPGMDNDELTGWCLQCGFTMYPKKNKPAADGYIAVSSDANNS